MSSEDQPAAVAAKKDPEVALPPAGQVRREQEKKNRALDKKIAKCEEAIQKLEELNAIANEKVASGHDTDGSSLRQLADNSIELGKLEAEWLELNAQREA